MRSRKSLAVACLVVFVVALSATGCGGSTKVTESQPGAPPQGAPGNGQGAPDMSAMEDFRACLKKQGVELPQAQQGQGPPQGSDPGSIDQDAMTACKKYLPSGGPPAGMQRPAP